MCCREVLVRGGTRCAVGRGMEGRYKTCCREVLVRGGTIRAVGRG